MIWLTWRQHRWEAALTATLVAGVAVALVVQGLRAAALAAELGLTTCSDNAIAFGGCGPAFLQFDREFGWMRAASFAFILLPTLAAPFLGAPLVAREYELRTSLLVWAQGVTRGRWLTTKVLLFAAVLAIGALLLAAVGPIAQQIWRTPPRWHESFEWTAPVLLGSTLFALALGVFCGALTRRVLGAMLVALVLVALARIGVTSQLRPNYLPPLVATAHRDIPTDAWILGTRYVDANGYDVPIDRLIEVNNDFFRSGSQRLYANSDDFFAERGLFFQGRYHPRERNALFQLIELGVHGVLAIALFGASLWLVRKRPA